MGVELIDFDERYKRIFEYLLGRVVVVKDLNAAIALSQNLEIVNVLPTLHAGGSGQLDR